MPKSRKKLFLRLTAFIFLSIFYAFSLKPSFAADALTQALMRLDRMKAGEENVTILIEATPASTVTEDEFRIIFAVGFGVTATAAEITVSTAGIPTDCTAMVGIGSSADSVSSQTVNFDVDDLDASTKYCFFITAGIDNPGSANAYTSTLSTRASSADVDVSEVTTRILTNDQIVISATVPPTFSFTFGANADSFTSDLDSSTAVSTSGVTITIGTNAANGWIVWLQSANAGLDSVTTATSIDTIGSIDDSPNDLTNGVNGFVLDVDLTTDSGTSGTGTVTIDPEYNGVTGEHSGGTLNGSSLEPIASADGTTDNDVITLIGRASISAIQEAASDYTDTWTVVGAANY